MRESVVIKRSLGPEHLCTSWVVHSDWHFGILEVIYKVFLIVNVPESECLSMGGYMSISIRGSMLSLKKPVKFVYFVVGVLALQKCKNIRPYYLYIGL